MLEVSELTYAAIITLELPGMGHPATVSLTLTPPDIVETAPGNYKALRDCTLADIQAFAEAMEAALWEKHCKSQIGELVEDEAAAVKITLINESGKALALSREQVLQHAIRTLDAPSAANAPESSADDESTETTTEQVEEGTSESRPPDARLPGNAKDPTEVQETSAEPAVETPAEELALSEPDRTADLPSVAEGPALPSPPDADEVHELRIAGLRRPLGHGTKAAVDILINEPAMRDAQAHAVSSMDREVAGMLIGPRPEKQPDGRYVVHITDIIVAQHTRMMGASVTYTPESWRYVSDRLQEEYPNEEAVIVGWYHTHPGFGIFLSGMDLFIHQNFFTQLWHVALVLDPRAARMGFFCWNRKQSEVSPYEFPWPHWAPQGW